MFKRTVCLATKSILKVPANTCKISRNTCEKSHPRCVAHQYKSGTTKVAETFIFKILNSHTLQECMKPIETFLMFGPDFSLMVRLSCACSDRMSCSFIDKASFSPLEPPLMRCLCYLFVENTLQKILCLCKLFPSRPFQSSKHWYEKARSAPGDELLVWTARKLL